MTLPNLANSLAGRIGIVLLLTLAYAEYGSQSSFLEQVVVGEMPESTVLMVFLACDQQVSLFGSGAGSEV